MIDTPADLTPLASLLSIPTHSRMAVRAGIDAWHSTHHPPVGWRAAFLLVSPGAAWGDIRAISVIGVSTWGRPVARAEDQVHTLEHTRMALSPQCPKNSASWFLARNREWIRRNLPEVQRLISYVDESDHIGVTYRADNWRTVYRKFRKAQSWTNRPGRKGRPAKLRTKFEREP